MKRARKRKVSRSSTGRKRSTLKRSASSRSRERGNAKAGAAVDASGAKARR